MAEIPIEKLSPMLRQYMELKAERPEVILLIRVGDFFEAYGVDATLIAAALDITLTGRDVNGMEERLPMAGVPYHALDRYLARLVQQGHKVAICDQIEDPKQAKGLVRRAITRVVTPGTLVEDALLDARSNNFLVAAILRTPIAGIGVVDVSRGHFADAYCWHRGCGCLHRRIPGLRAPGWCNRSCHRCRSRPHRTG